MLYVGTFTHLAITIAVYSVSYLGFSSVIRFRA